MEYLLASGVLLLFLDQASKRLIHSRSASRPLRYRSIVELRHVSTRRRHYESAYAPAVLLVIWCAALIAAITIHESGVGLSDRVSLIAIGAALGGAAGNLLDIVRSKSVTDFIDLGWWPVFNLADVAIIAGLAIAFLPR